MNSVMHSVRFVKVYYIAAFLLGAIIALLIAAPARGADTLPVDAIVPEPAVVLPAFR